MLERSFTDSSGPGDNWSATVSYDNGPTLAVPLNPDKTFLLQHSFSGVAAHTVTIRVTDRFGQSDTRTFAVNVLDVAPSVAGTQINDGGSQRSRLGNVAIQFSKNVGPSLSLADIQLRNLTTGTDVPASQLAFSFDAVQNVLKVTVRNGVVLNAGNYRLTLLAQGITDAAGQALPANVTINFYILPGDTNNDRVVNDVDLLQAWRNARYPSPQPDLNGDLNGDGQVNFADLSLVQSNYLATLPRISGAAAPLGSEALTVPVPTMIRELPTMLDIPLPGPTQLRVEAPQIASPSVKTSAAIEAQPVVAEQKETEASFTDQQAPARAATLPPEGASLVSEKAPALSIQKLQMASPVVDLPTRPVPQWWNDSQTLRWEEFDSSISAAESDRFSHHRPRRALRTVANPLNAGGPLIRPTNR